MKTKNMIAACLMIAALFTNCGDSSKSTNQETILENVPEELRDTAVISNDEESALDKLNAVIDSASDKK